MTHPVFDIPKSFHVGRPVGITSVCAAHPVVIEASLPLAKETGKPAPIEATYNPVNQDGRYTGMTPASFRTFVRQIAESLGFETDPITLGGDHLGPTPWKDLPAEAAMAKAEVMIAAFAEAGFTKLHLDISMGCANEPGAAPDGSTAAVDALTVRLDGRSLPEPVFSQDLSAATPGPAHDIVVAAVQDVLRLSASACEG